TTTLAISGGGAIPSRADCSLRPPCCILSFLSIPHAGPHLRLLGDIEMHAPSGFAIFHLFLAGAAKARPGNGFQTLDFDGIFTAGTDAIVFTIDAFNGVLNRT